MKPVTILYIINTILLLLHEIESAYEQEWKLLKLPIGITGFLVLHVPIIFLLLYGLIEINNNIYIGYWFGVITGIGGLMPYIVHKIIVKTANNFNLVISNIVIYLNVVIGIILIYLSTQSLM